jgi:nucleoside-diphosphate-sugar epimerase
VDALVIGGTGPTGPFIVEGLIARGYRVTILHTGRHEAPGIADAVEHLHVDPYDGDALEAALAERRFTLCVATYGRLRRIAAIMQRRCERFVSIGGGPAYLGYMNPAWPRPAGLPVPVREDAPRVERPDQDEKGFRIARTEDAVFACHPTATHFRYPIVYGPRQLMPVEWCVVRRLLDGRPHIVLPDGGLTLCHAGYVENLAHAVLLAVDHPDASAGRVYNCGDATVLTLAQRVEVMAAALGRTIEIVSMPWGLALPARPLVMQPLPTHRVYDLARLQGDLGYRDVVDPAEGLARTARWLAEHPPEPGGTEETVLEDPFDYAAEDRLIESWRSAVAGMAAIEWKQEPGFTLSYSGPGGRARSSPEFDG